MGGEHHDEQDGEDEESILARLSVGLPSIVGDLDQLRASLVGYATTTNAVYLELLKVFPANKAQKMAAVLWDRLVMPVDDDEVYEVPE
jgi:hypothetical protein